MPLLYVHGVNTRRGDTPEEQQVFDNRTNLIKEQFRQVAFADRVTAPDGLAVFAPYWGDLGVKFARKLACLPQSGVQALAVGEPGSAALTTATAANVDGADLRQPNFRSQPLTTVAKTRSFAAAVDLLFAAAATAPVPGVLAANMTAALPGAARFAGAAEQYAAANPKPDWLDATQDDDTFVANLFKAVTTRPAAGVPPGAAGPKVEALGIGDDVATWLKNGARAARDAVGNVVAQVGAAAGGAATDAARTAFLDLSGFVRPAASAFIGRFVGDAFAYLENRKPIIDRVMVDLNKALAARRAGDSELYLVGHSFGGIILYDILTAFPVDPPLQCQLYVTVGSQVALFAEIDRLADKPGVDGAFAKGAAAVVPRPAAAQRWVNIFDLTDFFGFGTKGVFAGATDFQFKTDALPLVSHAAYFETPRFFARLRERVTEAFATGTG